MKFIPNLVKTPQLVQKVDYYRGQTQMDRRTWYTKRVFSYRIRKWAKKLSGVSFLVADW